MLFQTCMTYFVLENLKGEILKSVYAAVFHKQKDRLSNFKMHKKHYINHYKCHYSFIFVLEEGYSFFVSLFVFSPENGEMTYNE